ncbi:MAG TPA: malate/lactate/ureidoglycolate dehydrogenase [Burkholderiaceae bacterium]|nr:malate/lactate/ureidoglycolate dehydrogenase [Burkholderiaceae bacterium]
MGIVIAHGPLRDFVAGIFVAAGSRDEEARQIADHLVDANLAGHDSHGIGLVPAYLVHRQAGWVHPNREPLRVGGSGPFAVFDGQMGYGHPIANAVTAETARIAADNGVAIVTLRNVQHIGRVGAYAEQLAARGLISIHFVNAVYDEPCVAPYLGSDARLMTNPVCIAMPSSAPGVPPVLLDFATSGIAMGKVRVAYNKGVPVAPGRLIDHAGQPTQSPAALFEAPKGALLPFGDHKGWGLAFIAELLGGGLTGGPTADQERPRQGLVNGMLTLAFDPKRLDDSSPFGGIVERLTAYVKASPPADPAAPVLVPGEPEVAMRRERGEAGIPVDDTTWKQIVAGAGRLGVAVPTVTVQQGD